MEPILIQNAAVFKAFCDENRLAILQLLCTGEKCACRLLEKLAIGQSTLSHHMKVLCESGMVKARRDGRWMYYSIDREGGETAAALLRTYVTVVNDAPDTCCRE